MSVEPQQQFEHTAVNGAVTCFNCMADGVEYRYTDGRTHGTVVLCDDCVQVERLRNGRSTLSRTR